MKLKTSDQKLVTKNFIIEDIFLLLADNYFIFIINLDFF